MDWKEAHFCVQGVKELLVLDLGAAMGQGKLMGWHAWGRMVLHAVAWDHMELHGAALGRMGLHGSAWAKGLLHNLNTQCSCEGSCKA